MTIANHVCALPCNVKPIRFSKPYRFARQILSLALLFTRRFTRRSLGVGGSVIGLLLLSLLSQAQTLRGTLRDADNGDAVTGATVTLRFSLGGAVPISLASTPTGEFVFEKIRAGYYSVEIMAQGFENQTIAEVNVTAGKEQVLDIALRRTTAQLAEVTILAAQPGRRAPLPLGEIPLTRDQTQRFPAMYFDPARLAAAYPGVAQVDDGTNMLSIRGNSPSSVGWRLEGVDIVNPNHLPNAGTFSDRPAAASGGILMFSAQLLDNSSLLSGPMPAGYGGALGGIMDMNLRRGNNRQHEFTAQAGLIGLDLAAEGPLFGRKSPSSGEPSAGKTVNGQQSTVNGQKSSYLVNYRYSTVGLLGQLGVSFGDEQINFQDLSFSLNMEGKRGGRWSLFGLAGFSENTFKYKKDSTEIKAYKDFFDIDFESKTGVLGASNWLSFGKNAWVKTTVAISQQLTDRSSHSFTFTDRSSLDDIEESKISASSTYSQRISQKYRLQVGVLVTTQKYNGVSGIVHAQECLLAQPWTQLSWQSRNQKNTTSLGLHTMIFDVGNDYYSKTDFSLEPRFLFSRKIAENHRLSFSAGGYSQVPSPWLLDYRVNELLRSGKMEMAYSWNFAPFWQFKTALYRQRINNAPYFVNEHFALLNDSEFNLGNDFSSYNTARGFNRGIEASVERNLSNGWFMLINGSLFGSKFSKTSSPSETDWLSTRWDIGHIANTTFGKEWQREKRPGKERTIGLNARIVWAGGVREAEINRDASVLANTTVVDERIGYSRQYPDYFRLDLRVYWRKNLGNRRNSTFALDIQNLTAQQNLAYHYYDPYTGQIENKYQLGPIPNFSWRVEF
ncbi:MAG: TonB-dependent receptor [Phycisphaerae bacterium]|nr:TonB-dependent receptor [Saprospiraceae bacterium]